MQTGRVERTDDRKALERLCVVMRLVRPVGELLRFVLSPDAVVTPDLRRVLPGRGVWVTANRVCVEQAIRKKAFARAFKQPVIIPDNLPDMIDRLFESAALDMLSLSNKAGLVLAGTAKVAEAVAAGRAVAVIHARNAAEDGVRKLAQVARRAYVDKKAPETIANFDSVHLDLALGRTNVIHVALCAGPAANGFLDRVAALMFWQDGAADPALPQGKPLRGDEESFTRGAYSLRNGVTETLIEPGRPAGFGTE